MCVCVCVCLRERISVCVGVCVSDASAKGIPPQHTHSKFLPSYCLNTHESECVCVCVCVCVGWSHIIIVEELWNSSFGSEHADMRRPAFAEVCECVCVCESVCVCV